MLTRKKTESSILCFLLLFLLQLAETMDHQWPEPKKHFVLVHGGCHGAWSWYKIIAMLRSSGHNVTALDLGASGINPQQVLEIPRQADYFKPLMAFMASLPSHQRVILVAHSFGGLAISKAMETFPEKICVAVFVTAVMPGPSLDVSTLLKEKSTRIPPMLDSRYTYDNGPHNPPTTIVLGSKYIAEYVYQLSPVEDLALATTLLRPLHLYTYEDMSNELVLSRDKYGSVARVFIISGEDKDVGKDFQEWMIQKNPPNEVREIEGSDHVVMMSRPVQLFVNLLSIADKYGN